MQIKVSYITANEIMEILGIGRSKAYDIVREMNQELENAGYNVIKGKVPVRYFQKKYYANLSSDNPTALNMPEIIKMALQAKIDMQIVNSRNSDAKRQELYKKYQPILNELQKYADILKEPELENYDC